MAGEEQIATAPAIACSAERSAIEFVEDMIKQALITQQSEIKLRRGNQWVILAGFQLGILLDLIFMRGRKETIELAA